MDPQPPTETLDTDLIKDLINRTKDSPNETERCHNFILIYKYMLNFPELSAIHPELAFIIRKKCQETESAVGDLIAYDKISFDLGIELVQLAGRLLEMTNELAEFDCNDEDDDDDEKIIVATQTPTQTLADEISDESSDEL